MSNIEVQIMSLPFLRKKQTAAVIIRERKPDGSSAENGTEGEENHGLKQCILELFKAARADDEEAGAKALRSAFQILDSEPHEEGEHTNEDYDSQNERAAQENE